MLRMIQLMMYDVGCFLCVFFIFMIAFQFAFLVLFAGVRGSVFQTNQNWGDSFLTLFDTMLGNYEWLRVVPRARATRPTTRPPRRSCTWARRSSCSTSRSRRSCCSTSSSR